jgi:hypothetical protein
MTSSASNNCFFGSNLHPKKNIIGLSRAQTLARPKAWTYKRAKKTNKQTMAYSKFASLNESELSKLLADKDSESTKKATKG